ncbi:MAG: lipase/acylhydrolase [Caulobacteraceae bacterium]|nr:lipase/acylhydrolase [Caulobacteraceae bacterium]
MALKATSCGVAAAVLAAILVPGVLSGSVRAAYGVAAQRFVASHITPPRFVLIGDSLLAGAGWNFGPAGDKGWRSVNLARGGAMVSHATVQMAAAGGFRSNWILIEAGINDVVAGRSPQQIGQDYDALLGLPPPGARLVVTLIPPGSFRERNQLIGQANLAIRQAAQAHGAQVIDLTADLAPDGLIAPAYTTDGLHFSPAAYAVWSRRLALLLAQD